MRNQAYIEFFRGLDPALARVLRDEDSISDRWRSIRKRTFDIALALRAGHAEQQKAVHPGTQVLFDLAQQRIARLLMHPRESGHGCGRSQALGDEQGLNQLLELDVDFAGQGPDVLVLAQAAQVEGGHAIGVCSSVNTSLQCAAKTAHTGHALSLITFAMLSGISHVP